MANSPFRNVKNEGYAAPVKIQNGADVAGISPSARAMLDGILATPGITELRVNSGYRSPARNKKAKGAKKSQHIHGNALDLDISGYTDDQKKFLLNAALKSGARGVGIYPSGNSLHVDTRSAPGFWGTVPGAQYAGADYRTAPAWAQDDLKALFGGGKNYPQQPQASSSDVASVTAPPSDEKVSWTNPVQPQEPWTHAEQREQQVAADAKANPYGPVEGTWEAVKDAQTIGWMMSGRTDLNDDPDWQPTADTFKVAREGIPETYWGALDGARSQAQLEQKRANLMRDMEHESRLDAMGWGGTAIRLGASLTDIPGLALTALAPEIGLPARAAMLAKVGVKAAEGAVINTALEVPRVVNKPTAHASEILWAAGSGMAMGGAFGAIARNPAVAEEAAQIAKIGKTLMNDAENEMAGVQMPNKSIGAAQNSPRETLSSSADDWLHSAVDDAIDRAAFGKIRWDDAGRGKSSDNAATRAFVAGTALDVVGNSDKSKVVKMTAEEWQKQLDHDFTMKAFQTHRETFGDYLERNPPGERSASEIETDFRSQVTRYLDNRRPEIEFDPAVKRAGDTQRQLYAQWLDYMQNPGKLDGTTRRPMKGAENLVKDPNYRPNIPDHEKIDLHSVRFGDDAMRQAIAANFRATLPELAEGLAEKMAKGYWRTLRETSAGMSNLDRAIHGADTDVLKKALQDIEMDEKDIDAVISLVQPKPTEGSASSHVKRRSPYSNDFAVKLKDKNGELVEFKMSDLFRDDYLENFRSYTRTMSGNVAMSMLQVRNPLFHAVDNPTVPEFLIDGIAGKSDFDKVVRDMRAVWDAKTELPFDKRKRLADRDEKRMQWLYDRVIGIPDAFETTTAGKTLRAIRDYNFARVMNQVGLAQVGEMMGVTTQFGLKAAMQGMPTLRTMMRDARTGQLNSEFAREMESLTGFGTDFFRDGFRMIEDGTGAVINRSSQGKTFNKIENVLHTAKRVTNVASGMAPVDTFSRRWASAAAVMKIVNGAIKSEKGAGHGLNMDRMRALGIDDDMMERVFSQIRKHSTTAEAADTTRKYAVGNFGKWDDQEAFSHFRNAVWRWSRLAIQENHLGQSNAVLGSWYGRTIFQFRSFMLGAHTTQLLRNAHIRDWTGFSTWMMTSVTGAMVYAAQSHLNSIGRSDRKEFLEKKLSNQALVAAMVQRGSWSSLIPQFVDTGAQLTGFDAVFDTRASGTGSSFLNNPTFDLLNTTQKAIGGAARGLREGGWSQGEARATARTLPFQNMLPVIPLLNHLISGQPERASGN